MGSTGKEWPLVAGPGWGPPERDRQGAWAKPLTPNFCARGRAHPGPFVPAGNQDQIKKSRCGVGCGPVTVRFEEAQRPGVQWVRTPCGLAGHRPAGWGGVQDGFGFESLAATKVKKIITSPETWPLPASTPAPCGKTGPGTPASPQA